MEYTTLIDRILETERVAEHMTEEAQRELAGLQAHLEAESRRIRENMTARAQERLDKLRQETQIKKERAIAAQDARLADTSERIERAYAKYGDNWVDTLFRQTVDIP